MPGVISTSVGYSGGTLEKPTYEDVCRGQTGHSEVLEVVYDPAKVSYDRLLDVFWNVHDPTYARKAQYQSVIFTFSPEQEAQAHASKERRQEQLGRPVETVIRPAAPYYRAEERHQQYVQKVRSRR